MTGREHELNATDLETITESKARMKFRKVPSFLILILSLLCFGLLQYHRSIQTNVLAFEPKSHPESTGSISSERRQEYYVRHCITERILGKVEMEMETNVPFEVSYETSPEIGENRKSSFEEIFISKLWIPPEEEANEKQASGNDISMLSRTKIVPNINIT